jgi:hypothetical protein
MPKTWRARSSVFVLGDRAPRPAELPPTPREALEKLLQLYGGLCR